MSTPMRPYVLAPGEGTRVRNPVGGELVFKLEGSQCADATNVLETEAAAGEGPPLHFHETQDEWLYVLSGSFRFRLDDDVVAAPVGTFVFIPRGVPHTWQNVGEGRGSLLGAFVPPALEAFFKRFAELESDEATIDAFRTLAKQAGMVVVGPPLADSHSPSMGSR
jgi:quercetin dioxygenase-like cupin family protein